MKGKLIPYATARDKRAAMISRIDYWRNAPTAHLDHGFNGEGRARVPVWYCDSDRHGGNDFLRDPRPVHDVLRDLERKGEVYRRDIHNGWYTDPNGDSGRDGSGLCWGNRGALAARLVHRRL
jgi:hypothetical protein